MSEKWPNNWRKLYCPNGHELQSYDQIIDNRLYCICDVCKVPCAFENLPVAFEPPVIEIRLPPDTDNPIDLPLFEVKPDDD